MRLLALLIIAAGIIAAARRLLGDGGRDVKVEFYYPREDMFSEFWLETPEYRDETSGNDR